MEHPAAESGHAGRHAGLKGCCTGLSLPGSRSGTYRIALRPSAICPAFDSSIASAAVRIALSEAQDYFRDTVRPTTGCSGRYAARPDVEPER
jgi:hypothetical protein